MRFINEYKEVQAHGNTKLHVIHTNNRKHMATSLTHDKTRLELVNLQVANFIGIQKEWRVPEATKGLESLADIAGMLFDDYYNDMKKKFTNEEHTCWGSLPLSKRNIEYTAKDTYTAYEISNRITLTQDGLHCAKLEKQETPMKRARSWGD
ncbi:hypothetical protein ZWY2020_033856 [Hordeum vulgare]|nr:hypothetical protein ZWY2020_033856 [Hordeum vulgare]